MLAQQVAPIGQSLSADQMRAALTSSLEHRYTGAKVLVLIPDHTRTMPLGVLFPMLVEILADVKQLDFLVALGTHPPLNEAQLCELVGITPGQKAANYPHIGLLNHDWQGADSLVDIGTISREQMLAIAGEAWHPSLGGDVPVRINRLALEYDQILIVGPVFPHEVVGYSGGAKYLFPGIFRAGDHQRDALAGGVDPHHERHRHRTDAHPCRHPRRRKLHPHPD